MTQYGFYFDSTRCTGCRTCEMACKDYNDLPASYAFRRVFDYEGGDWKDNGDGTFEPTSWAYHVSHGLQPLRDAGLRSQLSSRSPGERC